MTCQTMKRRLAWMVVGIGGLLLCSLLAPASANAQISKQPEIPPIISPDPIDPNLPIKPGYTIHVDVDQQAEPSGNYVVDALGWVLVNIAEQQVPVSVKDQTATQAAATFTTFLKKYLKDPKVTVSLIKVPRPIVYVSGCIQISGPVLINKRTRLVDVLNRSEWTEKSDLSQVHLTRTQTVNGAETRQDRVLHVDTYMWPDRNKPLDVTQNPLLQDKDEIFVPFKTWSGNGGITIMGEVLHPTESMFPRPNMTIREAISIAGGTTIVANRKTVSVKRGVKTILLDLDKAETSDPANNIVLLPGDNIQVESLPPSLLIDVEGSVIKPGKYLYTKGMTVKMAILVAGDPSSIGKDKDGFIVRYPETGNPKQ